LASLLDTDCFLFIIVSPAAKSIGDLLPFRGWRRGKQFGLPRPKVAAWESLPLAIGDL
jgi:hypothetical protein